MMVSISWKCSSLNDSNCCFPLSEGVFGCRVVILAAIHPDVLCFIVLACFFCNLLYSFVCVFVYCTRLAFSFIVMFLCSFVYCIIEIKQKLASCHRGNLVACFMIRSTYLSLRTSKMRLQERKPSDDSPNAPTF